MYVYANDQLPGSQLPGIDHKTLAGADFGARQLSLWRQSMAPGMSTPPHRHDCEEVVLVQSGRGHVLIDGRRIDFGPDSTLVLPAGVDHQIINSGDQPLCTLAVFPATPVGTLMPDGAPIALPWRS